MPERVVITGLGAVTPFGDDPDALFDALMRGERAVHAPRRLASSEPASRAVGEVPPEVLEGLRSRHPELGPDPELRVLVGHAAACAAARDAGLQGPNDEAAVILGSGPGCHYLEDVHGFLDHEGRFDARAHHAGTDHHHRHALTYVGAAEPAQTAARHLRLGGPVHAVTTACSASNQAIGMAYRLVRSGEVPFAIAGGADAMVNPLGLVYFVLLGAYANVDTGDEASSCRPFDRRRSGLVIAEGAGAVVLESEAHARARGAKPRAEMVGYGSSFDAYRITAPPPDGRGAVEAIRAALASGDVDPTTVDFVNAHGTGTKRNDPAEAAAVRTVFGPAADALSVSSGKGAVGHLLSGAAAVGFVLTTLAVERDAVPPTANLEQPDAHQDLDLVPRVGKARQVRAAINNSFAFGGQNAVTVVRKVDLEEDA